MTDRAQILWAVLGVLLLGAIGIILVLVRRRRLRGKYGLLWLLVAAALVPLATIPGAVDWSARELGVYYSPTVILLAGLGLLTLLSMHFSWELSRLEERSRTLAEEVALLRSDLERAERVTAAASQSVRLRETPEPTTPPQPPDREAVDPVERQTMPPHVDGHAADSPIAAD